MADGKKFSKGQMFAWGSTIHRADSDCEVWPGIMMGDATELIEFMEDFDDVELAVKVCDAIGAYSGMLMLGSMTGEDDEIDPETGEYDDEE